MRSQSLSTPYCRFLPTASFPATAHVVSVASLTSDHRCSRFFTKPLTINTHTSRLRCRATLHFLELETSSRNETETDRVLSLFEQEQDLLTTSTMSADEEENLVADVFVTSSEGNKAVQQRITAKHQQQHNEAEKESSNSNEINDNDDKKDNNTPAILGMPPKAIFALNTVAIIWGTQHAVIKMVVDDSDAGPFTLLRFGIGAVIASAPLLWKQLLSKPTTAIGTVDIAENRSSNADNADTAKTEAQGLIVPTASRQTSVLDGTDKSNLQTVLRYASEMGGWMFLGFAFQAIGLATTTAQRSGFLLYLNVKFVPFFAFLLLGKQISVSTWVSALTAFSGTALLAYDGTSWSLNQGDLWSIAAAAASAMFILRLDVAAKAVGDANTVQLNAACLWVVTFLSCLWSIGTVEDPSLILPQLVAIVQRHPWEMIYLSAVTTALANFIQTKSQKDVSAERASVIYAMDPVYGAFFSNLLLGETLTSLGYVGAAMITLAAATNALLDLGGKPSTSSKSQ